MGHLESFRILCVGRKEILKPSYWVGQRNSKWEERRQLFCSSSCETANSVPHWAGGKHCSACCSRGINFPWETKSLLSQSWGVGLQWKEGTLREKKKISRTFLPVFSRNGAFLLCQLRNRRYVPSRGIFSLALEKGTRGSEVASLNHLSCTTALLAWEMGVPWCLLMDLWCLLMERRHGLSLSSQRLLPPTHNKLQIPAINPTSPRPGQPDTPLGSAKGAKLLMVPLN